ncbi:MAG: ABC transporter ATP-binding protein [Proteobacteria bacterium]|nr:ABC transporter ATP-binding protein [Pseudomonadota bacterium]
MFREFAAVHQILTVKQRRHYYALLVLFTFGALLQVAGVASLAPFIALLSSPALIQDSAAIAWLYSQSHATTVNGFLTLIALAIIALIIVTNAVAAISMWALFSFSMSVGHRIQLDVFRSSLYQSYVDFGRRNSADMITMLVQEGPRFIYMVVQPTLQVISQAMVVIIVAIVLVAFNPKLALIALLIIGLGYAAIFAMVKERLTVHGDAIWRTTSRRQRVMTEAFGGMKEIKLNGTEWAYERDLERISGQSNKSLTMISLLSELPRFMLETIAFAALLAMAIVLLLAGTPTMEIVATLSLYATAGYKLLPAAQTVFKSFSSIKANQNVIENLFPHIVAGRSYEKRTPRTHHAADKILAGDIQFSNLSFRYPGAAHRALTDVDVVFPAHRITAIVGPSGAGKSTLLDLLLGLLEPDTGVLTVGAKPISKANLRAWQNTIGYVPQHIFLVDDTIAVNISLGSVIPPSVPALEKAVHSACLDSYIAGLKEGFEYVVGERGALLSGGQRQRLGIARALYSQPAVVIMDEATSALDSTTEDEVMATVAGLRDQATVVLVAHRASTIRYADHVVVVNGGRIEDSGPLEAVLSRNAFFRRLMNGDETPDDPASTSS